MEILSSLEKRLKECKLEIYPLKTKIVYCQDKDRTGEGDEPARLSGSRIEMIEEAINPMVRGWLNYFKKYCPSTMKYTMDYQNRRLVRWAMQKYQRFRGHRKR